MRPRGFIDEWRPRQKSLRLLAQVEAVIALYDMALTLRQIFYRLVARYNYAKTERAYGCLGDLLNMARRAGRIPMEAIRDDGAVNYEPLCFTSLDDFLAEMRGQAEHLRLDRQTGQPRRLVVMCEAAGMAAQLYRVTEPYGIAVLSAGGFDSTTEKHRLAGKWARAAQPTTVLRVGDYDPSGETMAAVLSEDIGAFVAHFGGDVAFEQVAITPQQARTRGLPSAPPKATDKRGRYFTGSETWQAEALDPNDLAAILEGAILARFDHAIYDAVLAEEDDIRRAAVTRLG